MFHVNNFYMIIYIFSFSLWISPSAVLLLHNILQIPAVSCPYSSLYAFLSSPCWIGCLCFPANTLWPMKLKTILFVYTVMLCPCGCSFISSERFFLCNWTWFHLFLSKINTMLLPSWMFAGHCYRQFHQHFSIGNFLFHFIDSSISENVLVWINAETSIRILKNLKLYAIYIQCISFSLFTQLCSVLL